MDLSYYVVITFAWAVGGFISGITSMGCSLVALPILNLVMRPERAILISCVCGGIIPMVLALVHHRGLLWKELWLLIGSSLPGCILGVMLFERIHPERLNIALGVALAGFVAWQIRGGAGVPGLQGGVASLLAGFLSGAVNALTGAPGAVLGVYASLRTWTKENMLSMQSVFFAVSALLTVSVQWSRGLYSAPILFDITCSLPGAALGILASIPAQRFIDRNKCRRLLLILLAASSIMLLQRG